jgi:hypothetical protein
MKKILFIIILFIILTGTAFAEHPSGFALGGVVRWQKPWQYDILVDLSVCLKVTIIPVYWNIDFIRLSPFNTSDLFLIGISGDFYLIDRVLIHDLNLHYFLGLGAYIYHSHGFGTGVRLPAGLSWWPINMLELFFNIAPSLGIKLNSPADSFPDGGFSIETGVRFWF